MKTLKKIALILFCVLFFAVCAFFSLGMLIPGSSEATEGAGEFPALLKDGAVNGDFGDEFEAWFSKKFAFRGYVVDAFSAIRETVFRTGNEQVVVGEQGFLFFAETVDAYTGLNPMTEDEIAAACDSLAALSEYAEEHGARFVFVCAPNKATVYPDKMPAQYEPCDGETDLDLLLASLKERGVTAIDLRPTLTEKAKTELLYHKRDTHWNAVGALYAWNEITKTLGVTMAEIGEGEIVTDFEGDLDGLLYPGKTRYDTDVDFHLDGQYVFTSSYSNPMNLSFSTKSAGEGKLLLFRDSFANALIPFVSSTFGEVRYERANPYRIDLLEDFDADTVIVLIAERNLRDLIGCDGRIADEP